MSSASRSSINTRVQAAPLSGYHIKAGWLRIGRRHAAFTLIEMLVVIGIITLLAAILFPVFNQVRDKARGATCASNLHQIGLAFHAYQQDFDGIYPSTISPLGATCPWPDGITSYVKSIDIFKCPNNKTGYYVPGCIMPTATINGRGSYTMAFLNAGNFHVLDSSFTHPAGTIIVLDGVANSVNPTISGTQPLTSVQHLLNRGVEFIHNDGDNVLFADGHVKWLHADNMLATSLWVAGNPP